MWIDKKEWKENYLLVWSGMEKKRKDYVLLIKKKGKETEPTLVWRRRKERVVA